MPFQIAFFGLQSKFVNQETDIPAEARQVIYYSLAIGHHVGVLDCFSCLFKVPGDEFEAWLSQLPQGAGRTKLEGVLGYGEIEINKSHVNILAPLVQAEQPASPNGGTHPKWLKKFAACLQQMCLEPAYYLMVKKV